MRDENNNDGGEWGLRDESRGGPVWVESSLARVMVWFCGLGWLKAFELI